MGKYLFTAQYSSGSWARLVKGSDDRVAAVRSMVEALGGSLDHVYWGAHSSAAHVIADLPDAVVAKAVLTTVIETGAFSNVEATELLTQEELRDSLILARSAQEFYDAPGKSAVEEVSF
jgi:uncharacterized protein with GYD domain